MAHSSLRDQFGDLARRKGGQELLIPFWTDRVMAWRKYLSPRKFVQGGVPDVEAFLQQLSGQGRAGWQIEQVRAGCVCLGGALYGRGGVGHDPDCWSWANVRSSTLTQQMGTSRSLPAMQGFTPWWQSSGRLSVAA